MPDSEPQLVSDFNAPLKGGRKTKKHGKRHGNASLRAWVTFVKKVAKEENLSYRDAMMRAKSRKDKGEKWMKGGEDGVAAGMDDVKNEYVAAGMDDVKNEYVAAGMDDVAAGMDDVAAGMDDVAADMKSPDDMKMGGRRRRRNGRKTHRKKSNKKRHSKSYKKSRASSRR